MVGERGFCCICLHYSSGGMAGLSNTQADGVRQHEGSQTHTEANVKYEAEMELRKEMRWAQGREKAEQAALDRYEELNAAIRAGGHAAEQAAAHLSGATDALAAARCAFLHCESLCDIAKTCTFILGAFGLFWGVMLPLACA